MTDEPIEWTRDAFTISTDRHRLDLDVVHAFLASSYWAEGMPRSVLERGVANSVCFGVYEGQAQVGFARAITDLATYAYLSDVFILESHRGRGLGKWLVACMVNHPGLRALRRVALFTRDAQGLYEPFGFGPPTGQSTYMEIRDPDVYRRVTNG